MQEIAALLTTIPHIPRLPIFGNLLDFRHNRLAMLQRVARECGDVGVFYMGPTPIILFNTPEYVQSILVDHAYTMEKPRLVRKLIRETLGNGLLGAEGEAHKQQRKLIAPVFQHRRIAQYADSMAAHATRCVAQWTNGTHIDMSVEMMRLTLGIVGETLFGADVLDTASDLRHVLACVGRYANDQLGALVHLPMWMPTPRNQRTKQSIAQLDALMYRMIQARQQDPSNREDLLSVLLQAQDDHGNRMPDQQVRDEALTLFLAGHETTAMSLAWCWYLLARHPEVADTLHEEIDRVLQGRTPTVDDLPNLPYTLQVFKETIRLYPPGYILVRKAVRPVTIGAYDLPLNTVVAISPYLLHRRADNFPDPDTFNPDRFSAEAEKRLPRHAYIPFSAGARICIGNHFATMEAQLILATLAQKVQFRLTSPAEVVPDPFITLRPRGGVNMTVSIR